MRRIVVMVLVGFDPSPGPLQPITDIRLPAIPKEGGRS